MASDSTNLEPWYVSLLGLAENFRTSNPPNIRLCIHCLQSIFNFKPPPKIEARTHLQLGNILLTHTKNNDLARMHLEKAWNLSASFPSTDDVKFEAASILAQMFETQNHIQLAKPILKKAVEMSQQAPYWHCRLLFQLAQIHSIEKDFLSACQLLSIGADFAHTARSEYTRLLFLLSKGMLHLIDKKTAEVHETLSQAGALIESYKGQPVQKESLKVFFLVLQVCHYLMAGQVKSVKPALKNLQQIIQTITQLHTDEEPTSSNRVDLFHWLPIEHMCVLVYLVTVMHSMQAGYMDKAQKYTDKALMQIEKLKMLDAHPLLSQFQLMLLEHIIMCRLIMGNKTLAIQEIFQACHVCQQQPRLFTTHSAQIHTLLTIMETGTSSVYYTMYGDEFATQDRLLATVKENEDYSFDHQTEKENCTSWMIKLNEEYLSVFSFYYHIEVIFGLYAMSMNCMEAAEAQFNTAAKYSKGAELESFVNLNLSIVYLRTDRQNELVKILEKVEPEKLDTHSHSLKASSYYVRGLQAFFQARYNEAKRYLRETLKMANAEDLNRLTSCSLVLLGHIFLSLGNNAEALNMVTPAMQLAGKIPDVHVQLWASSLLKDLYRLCGDKVNEAEGYKMHTSFSQSLLKDHFQSSQLSEHGLIQWTEGPCPFHLNTSAVGSSNML